VSLRAPNRTKGPNQLLESDLTLSLEAFATITGDPEALDEADSSAPSA
jgi:hypothetical protein